jgi:hypothetical protein
MHIMLIFFVEMCLNRNLNNQTLLGFKIKKNKEMGN